MNPEQHFTDNVPAQNISNHPIILTNATQRNGTEYQMPLETVVKLSIACVGIPCNIIVTLVSARIFLNSARSHNILTLLFGMTDIIYLLCVVVGQKGLIGDVGLDGILLNCNILTFFIEFSGFASSWLVVFISCERFICVKWPIKMHLNHDRYRKWSAFVLVIMFLFLAGISSLQFLFIHVEESNITKGCPDVGTNKTYEIDMEVFTASLYGLIPTVLVLIFNLSILQVLVKHNQNKEHSPDGYSGSTAFKNNASVTKTILSVSFMFVLGRSPFSILYMVDGIFKLVTNSNLGFNRYTVYFILLTFDFLDHTWNLLVYVCSSSVFRSELYNMIKCTKGDSAS